MQVRAPLSRARRIVNRSGCPRLPRGPAVLFRGAMNDDSLLLAIDRLERAVTQLEQRLPAVLAPPPTDGDLQARYERLEERHGALRARTSAAVERLTLLLESAKGE